MAYIYNINTSVSTITKYQQYLNEWELNFVITVNTTSTLSKRQIYTILKLERKVSKCLLLERISKKKVFN